MKFFDDLDVFYINLDSRVDRLKYIKEHFSILKISNAKRINAITPDVIDPKIIEDGAALGVDKFSVAGGYSHLLAMKEFLDTSDKDYALIVEDDVELFNIYKIRFTIKDIFDTLHNKVDCLQFAVSTREDINPNFKIRLRNNWDFCAAAYVINKEYAKKCVDTYLSKGYFDISKFKSQEIIEYRTNKVIYTTPVPESIVYNLTNVVVVPIFTYIVTPTSMSFSTEAQKQEIKSRNDFRIYWGKYAEIHLRDLL